MIYKQRLPKDIIYLDNASTTIPYSCDLPENIWFNASAPYKGGVEAQQILKQCEEDILKTFNILQDGNVLFTSGATEANNLVIQYIKNIENEIKYNFEICNYDEVKKYNIVVSPIEHPSVLNVYKKISERKIIEVRYFSVNEYGQIIIDNLSNLIDDNTILVSCMYINNEVGSIQPIEEIGNVCQKTSTPFHVDATQAIGKIMIDCPKNDIDFLTFSAHKFHGPKGIGAIVCRTNMVKLLEPLLYGGHQQLNIRPGTENVIDIYLMTELLKDCMSIQYINKSKAISELMNKVIKLFLEKYFIKDDFKINSVNDEIPICNISFKNITGEYIVQELSKEGIYISSGSACNTGTFENSHVLEAMNVNKDFIEGTIRISFDIEDDNLTIANIERVIKKIKEIF